MSKRRLERPEQISLHKLGDRCKKTLTRLELATFGEFQRRGVPKSDALPLRHKIYTKYTRCEGPILL